jgi:hypothetical protein
LRKDLLKERRHTIENNIYLKEMRHTIKNNIYLKETTYTFTKRGRGMYLVSATPTKLLIEFL